MAWAKCHECGWDVRDLPTGTADAAWESHRARQHGEGGGITQLPGVTFHEQALLALRSLAETGRPFTVGEAHPMVSIPPTNPRTDWEVARKDAERLGWIEWTKTYADSIVPSTKGSAVKVWQGTYAVRRSVA
jgi:hypothetical protein